jgi:hypothetical protein
MTAGVIFGMITLVHIWRIYEEPNLARDPWFVFLTFATAGLALGAWRLVRRSKAS